MYGMAANYGGGGNRGLGQPMPQRQQGYNRRPQGNNRNNQNFRNSRFDQPQQNQNQNFNENRGNNQNVTEEKKEPVQNVVIPTKTEAPKETPAVVPVATTPKPVVQNAPVQAKPAPVVQPPVQAQPKAAPTPQPQQQPQQQAPPQRPQQQQQQNRPQQQQQRQPQQNQQQQRPQQQNQQQQRPQQQNQQQQRPPQQNQQQRPQQQSIPQLQAVVTQPATVEKANDNADANPGQGFNNSFAPGNQQGGGYQGGQQGGHQGGYQNHQGGQYNQNKQNNQFNKQGGGGGGRGLNQGGGGGGFKRQLQDKGPGGSGGGGGAGGNREEHMIVQKLRDIGGPTLELPPVDQDELRFSGRSRLYIGNLTNDVTDQEILDMFAPYGETAELFINKEKNFAFIRIDHRLNAEKARRELDGSIRKGRPLRVRFAPQNSCVKVTNLTPQVSNELLYRTFEIFGKIERAIVKVDERGKSLCEGIIEFARKASAQTAIRYCTERCYFITASLRPVIVEPFEEIDEVDGYPEKNLPKKNTEYIRDREVGPRFADLASFEHEYGTRWKQLHELYRQKEEALKAELADERDKLEAQMELARYEQETEMLREALRRREAERERAELNWRAAGDRREASRETRRVDGLRILDDVPQGPRVQDDDVRRRQQETTLFMQAQQLNSLLDQQEQGLGGGGYDAADSKRSFIDQGGIQGSIGLDGGGYLEHGRQYGGGDRAFDGDVLSGGRWRHDDFPNKRRRY